MPIPTVEDILFHSFAFVATFSAALVIFVTSPVYSALFLALAMSALAVLFFVLNAYFISVAQVTVYAGAVMVLFVMVLMLFDLKKEIENVLKMSPMTLAKFIAAGSLCGFLLASGVMVYQGNQLPTNEPTASEKRSLDEDLTGAEAAKLVEADKPQVLTPTQEEFGSTLSLSKKLFSKYIFGFEAVGIVILIVIVGTVALAKSRGGTHHVA